MYELYNGTARLVFALDHTKENAAAIKMLAHVLNYYPEQLQQDIQALYDFYQQAESNRVDRE